MNTLFDFVDHYLSTQFAEGYHFILLSAENATSLSRNNFLEFLGENGAFFHYEEVNEIVNHDFGLFYYWYNEDMRILKETGSRHLSHYLNLDSFREDGGQFTLIPELSFNNTRNMIVVFNNNLNTQDSLFKQINSTANFLRLHCDYNRYNTHYILTTQNSDSAEKIITLHFQRIHTNYTNLCTDILGKSLLFYNSNKGIEHSILWGIDDNNNFFSYLKEKYEEDQVKNIINRINELLYDKRFPDVMTDLLLHNLSSTHPSIKIEVLPHWNDYIYWYNNERL